MTETTKDSQVRDNHEQSGEARVPLAYRRSASCPFDPVAELLDLRTAGSITRQIAPSGEPVWLVVRHADVRQVLSDRRFSTALTPRTVTRPSATGDAVIASPTRQPGSLPGNDPPEHTRLRRMVARAFSARQMDKLRFTLTEFIDQRLKSMAREGSPTELVSTFAQPVASLAICELLGVPVEDREFFQKMSYGAFDRSLGREEMIRTFTAMWDYNSSLVARHRREPDDTVVGTLVRDHGGELSDDELTGLVNGLLIAGQDTSASMLALGVLLLLEHPRELAIVRDEPSSVHNAVEEMLRYLTVVQTGLVRTATEDVRLGDTLIRAGDYVMMSIAAANRDGNLYENPDQFDITRNISNHLAFGYGTHFCIGASLARHEMCIGFPALLRKFPSLQLATSFSDVQFRTFSTIHGVTKLPVSW